MVDLMTKLPTFCQPFFSRETKKLIASMTLATSSSSLKPTLPIATAKQRTFFSWNLMVDFASMTFELRSSAWEIGVGNLPAIATDSELDQQIEVRRTLPLDRPGPSKRGICLIRVSEARKTLYLRASFLISFLFLLSFLRLRQG